MKFIVAIVFLLPGGVARAALFTANFDGKAEGGANTVINDGGIRFHDYLDNPGGTAATMTIENASGGGLPSPFTTPNVMNFDGFSPGPTFGYGRVSSFQFDKSGSLLLSGDIDLFTNSANPATVALEGWLSGGMITSTSFAATSGTAYHHLGLLGTFDLFIVRSTGAADSGVTFMVADNVQINTVPEPAALGLCVAAAAALLRRRGPRHFCAAVLFVIYGLSCVTLAAGAEQRATTAPATALGLREIGRLPDIGGRLVSFSRDGKTILTADEFNGATVLFELDDGHVFR